MREVHALLWVVQKAGTVCALSICLTVFAAEPRKADHESATPNGSEYAEERNEPPKKTESPAVAELKATFRVISDKGLQEFHSKVSDLINLSPESFNEMVDKLPALDSDPTKDKALREQLKEQFKKNIEALAPDAKKALVAAAKDILDERKGDGTGTPEVNPEDLKTQLADALSKLNQKTQDAENTAKTAFDDLAKKFEEALKGFEEDSKDDKEDKNNNDLPFDPSALADKGAGNDSGAGSGSGETGSGSGSGGGGEGSGSGSDSGSGDSAGSSSPSEKGGQVASNSDSSAKPEESQQKQDNQSSDDSSRRFYDDDDSESTTETASTPEATPEPVTPSSPQKLGQLGPRNTLNPVQRSESFAGSANPGTTPSAFAGGATPMAASLGPSGGGGFPFSSAAPAAPARGQKYTYTRDNPYGQSSEGGGNENDYSNESDSVESQIVASPSGVASASLGERASAARGIAAAEPAFARAMGLTLGELCASGALNCDRGR